MNFVGKYIKVFCNKCHRYGKHEIIGDSKTHLIFECCRKDCGFRAEVPWERVNFLIMQSEVEVQSTNTEFIARSVIHKIKNCERIVCPHCTMIHKVRDNKYYCRSRDEYYDYDFKDNDIGLRRGMYGFTTEDL